MARMRFCNICGELTPGKCKQCFPKQSRHDRGYDSRWDKVRERVVTEEPLCWDCLERDPLKPNPTEEVHHIEPIKGAWHLRLDRRNLVPLCQSCHDARHGGKSQRSKEREYDGQETARARSTSREGFVYQEPETRE